MYSLDGGKGKSVHEALLPKGQDDDSASGREGGGGEAVHAPIKASAGQSLGYDERSHMNRYFWLAEAAFQRPAAIELDQEKRSEVQDDEEEALRALQEKVRGVTKGQQLIQPLPARLSRGYFEQTSLDDLCKSAQKDAKSHLKELGREHAQRDANTMLWQSQTKLLKKYVPESTLEEDVFFYGDSMFVCQQRQGRHRPAKETLIEDGSAKEKKETVFVETLELEKIQLTTALDMQHELESSEDVPARTFASVDTISVRYEDEQAFERFYLKYSSVMQQASCSGSGNRVFEIVTDGRMLYFWRFERTFTKDLHSQEHSGRSVFRLFRLDVREKGGAKEGDQRVRPEPEEIVERRIEIPDDGEKVALALGFLRNQTQRFYTNEISVFWPQQEDPFLDDQVVAVKYVFVAKHGEDGHHHKKPDQAALYNSFLVSIRHLRSFDREVAHYYFNLREKISVLRAVAEDFCEASSSHRNRGIKKTEEDNSKKKMHTTDAQRKEAKVKAMMHALKILFEKRLNLEMKKTVIVLRNNRLFDHFDLVCKKTDRASEGNYERQHREVKLSSAFWARFVQTVNNNCFVALYDYQRAKFFFKRCEPVVSSRRTSFMILDSIFSKIITAHRDPAHKDRGRDKSRGSWYNIFSRRLENYGQAFDALSPFLQAKQFDQFLPYQRKSALTTHLATEAAHMSAHEDLKHQQLVISKKFSNMARRDETILVWSNFSSDRPVEIQDERNQMPQLSLINATFLNNARLIGVVREQRQNGQGEGMSFLTMLQETRRKAVADSGRTSAAKTKTMREKFTRNIVQIASETMEAVAFSQENGQLKVRDKAESLKVSRFRRRSSLLAPNWDVDQSLGELSSQISGYSSKMEPLDRSEQLTRWQESKKYTEKMEESWRIVYEKVRFSEDDRTERPIVVYQTIRNERQKFLEIQFWLCVFNFQDKQISQQQSIWFPELDIKYEPQSVCLSASSEPVRISESEDGIDFHQNYQVSISLAHQRRVKIVEFVLSWGEDRHEDDLTVTNYVKEIKILHIGSKEFILKKSMPGKIEDTFNPQLLPLLNEKNEIEGTQLVFGTSGQPTIYYFPNKTEVQQENWPLNPIMEKQGYLLFRNKENFELDAVMAFAQIRLCVLKDERAQITYQDASSIVEQSVRVVLNSVVFDPMAPVYSSRSINFFLQNSIGRSFESLDWFSPISIKGIQKELEPLMIYEKLEECTAFERQQASPFSSLIERVMLNDFYKFQGESFVMDDECDMNFNRVATFIQDKLLFKSQEILQRDWQLNSPLHYFFDQDSEMDLVLSKVFKEREEGTVLPEAENILKSMTLRLVRRENPLGRFHKFFISQPDHIDANRKFENDGPGETMNIAQKVRGKLMPKKQSDKLQVFTPDITEHQSSLRIEQLVSVHLAEQTLAHGLDYEVETYIIDFRSAFLEEKVEWIKNRTATTLSFCKEPESGFTEYHLAQLINDMQANSACDLDEEALLRNLIDYQWKKTQWWQKRFFIFYITFYLIPFFYQVFQKDARTVIVCNCSCFVTMLFLFTYEFMQYYKTTFDDYIEDLWNKADVAHISMYGCCYFWLRISRPEGAIPDFFQFEAETPPWNDNYAREYAIKAILTFTNIILIVLAVLKLLNFLRIFEGFGLFILLIGQCLADIKLFFLFMILWLVVFTAMLYILNCDVPNWSDYPHLPWWLQLAIQVWRNSLGDIQPPEYSSWYNKYKELDELKATHAYAQAYKQPIDVIIGMLWFIWFLNCIFNQVIMLNFMIAIISESYERVMKQKDQLMYSYKCDINLEVEIFISYFEWLCVRAEPVFNSIILVTAGDPDGGEWPGFSAQVRGLIGHVLMNQKYYQSKAGMKLDKLVEKQIEVQEQVETAYEANKTTLKLEMQEVNIQISQMAKSLEQMGEAFETITNGLRGKPIQGPAPQSSDAGEPVQEIYDDQVEGFAGSEEGEAVGNGAEVEEVGEDVGVEEIDAEEELVEVEPFGQPEGASALASALEEGEEQHRPTELETGPEESEARVPEASAVGNLTLGAEADLAFDADAQHEPLSHRAVARASPMHNDILEQSAISRGLDATVQDSSFGEGELLGQMQSAKGSPSQGPESGSGSPKAGAEALPGLHSPRDVDLVVDLQQVPLAAATGVPKPQVFDFGEQVQQAADDEAAEVARASKATELNEQDPIISEGQSQVVDLSAQASVDKKDEPEAPLDQEKKEEANAAEEGATAAQLEGQEPDKAQVEEVEKENAQKIDEDKP